MDTIPKEIALEICRALCCERITTWQTWFVSSCWECLVLSNGKPNQMLFSKVPGNRGCAQVNAVYTRRQFAAPDSLYDRVYVSDEQC
ncbi:MAG: hypothetical protein HY327_11650 [Chloroflexi bacterium]|nr:hypothetical protein [Chloroflexota bacterium]